MKTTINCFLDFLIHLWKDSLEFSIYTEPRQTNKYKKKNEITIHNYHKLFKMSVSIRAFYLNKRTR